MLPTFPKVVDQRRALNKNHIHQLIEQKAPIFADIGRHFIHEGSGGEIRRHDESVGITDIKSHGAELTIPRMLVEEFDDDLLMKYLGEIAEQFAKSMSENLFSVVSEGATAVGNVVDGGGQPLGPEILLKAFDTLQMDFLPDGTWHAPTMVVSPDQYKKIIEMKKAGVDKTYDERLAKLVEKKRSEFLSREAGRVLAG